MAAYIQTCLIHFDYSKMMAAYSIQTMSYYIWSSQGHDTLHTYFVFFHCDTKILQHLKFACFYIHDILFRGRVYMSIEYFV